MIRLQVLYVKMCKVKRRREQKASRDISPRHLGSRRAASYRLKMNIPPTPMTKPVENDDVAAVEFHTLRIPGVPAIGPR
jgi:hypothetical protein